MSHFWEWPSPLFEYSPLPAFIVESATLQILAANQAAVSFYDYSREELKSLSLEHFHDPSDTASLTELMQKARSGVCNESFVQQTREGKEITIDLYINDIPSEGDRFCQVVVVPHASCQESSRGNTGSIIKNQANRWSEESLLYQATVLENLQDIIVTTDLHYNVRTWNRMAEQVYEISEEEAIGKSLGSLISFEYLHTTEEEALDLLERNSFWKGEVVFRAKSGIKNYFVHIVTYVYDDAGEKIGIMAVGRDITERKIAEERLRQSEKFYKSLIADSANGMIIIDETAKISFASPSVKNILHFDVNEVVGMSGFDFVHPEDQAWAFESLQREVKENPEVKSIVIRLRKKGGDWLWCMVRGHNLMNNPDVNGVVIYFHDDTLRKRASDALKESEQRFRNIIRDLQFGVVMQDHKGKVLMCNQAILDILEIKEEDLVGRSIIETLQDACNESGKTLPKEDLPLHIALHQQKASRNVVIGIHHPRFKQRKWVLVNSDPNCDENKKITNVICTITDITERKKLEQKLLVEKISQQRLLTQATIDGQEKERREIGKELHDNIGQQLTTTKLYLDLAKTTADDATMEMISLSLKSISDVINEIRSISRSLSPPTLGDLGLVESIHDLIESITCTQALDIELDEFNFSEKHIPENKKLMLFRIVQEQLNNIVKHAEAKRVNIMLHNSGHLLVLEIKDDGKGFNPRTARRGLGLTNMKNRAELFGGKIEITSTPGNGCLVRVVVPEEPVGTGL